MPNPYDRYRQNSVNTASREDLTLMLYEGALKFCNQAIVALERHDIEAAHNFIVRVENIIREFQVTLDKKYEVAEYLNEMYEYIFRRLVEANMKKDVEILCEVRDLLREFRDMWKEAVNIAKNRNVEPKSDA